MTATACCFGSTTGRTCSRWATRSPRGALKDSLSSISQNRGKLDKTPELTAETDALVVQRKAALDWLKQQTAERVYIALYPETEWQIGPVAGADDAEDGDDER